MLLYIVVAFHLKNIYYIHTFKCSYLILPCVSSVGAALVAENNHAPTVFAGIVYNPLCFLLYEDLRAPPNEWKDVSACTFSP